MAWMSFINADDPTKLVEALRVACRQSSEWTPLPRDTDHERAFGVTASLAADFKGLHFTGKELGICVFVWPDDPGRARVSMHASRWENDRSLPSNDEYGHALDLAAPLLAAAGKLLGRRLRLSRPPPDGVRPLRGRLAMALRRVTAVYERTSHPKLKIRALHPSDEKEFWRFIRIAHQHTSTLRPSDLACHLTAAGFHPELVAQLRRNYEVGRQILAVYDDPWDLRRDRKEERQRRKVERQAERARFEAARAQKSVSA